MGKSTLEIGRRCILGANIDDMYLLGLAVTILCTFLGLKGSDSFVIPFARRNGVASRHLFMSTSASSLTPDGGVVKEILAKGQGKKIEPGDILAVQYAASVKGASKPFAKGDQEKFVFKDGTLIKGWDIGVGSMQVGEKAKIVCTAPYAYGAKGVTPVIPPNADVEIDIRVLAWLGNQLRPESLFQKDLDVDPFIASTPESIQAEYEDMQVRQCAPYPALRQLQFCLYSFMSNFIDQINEIITILQFLISIHPFLDFVIARAPFSPSLWTSTKAVSSKFI